MVIKAIVVIIMTIGINMVITVNAAIRADFIKLAIRPILNVRMIP